MISGADLTQSKILIVDDEGANVELLDQMLEEEGYPNVKSLQDPRLVLEVYKAFQPDLVLLDLRMPHLDGFQVMKQLNAEEKKSYAPVLVLTAQADMDTRIRALNLGAQDFLTKPINIPEALCRIRNLLEIRHLTNLIQNQNVILEQKVKERTQALRFTRLEIINCLGRAAEYRDNETGMHVIRMSHFSQQLALEAGWESKNCELILHASPMHDVGKIGIPDRILLKPGKLDPEEWEIMKTHVTIGAEILTRSDSRLFRMARNIALHHHEKWDGSGYPGGLAGEAISPEGRIVAVCDVFDALTSERPYKKAWPVEDALQNIRENRGKHFEPQLVDKFLKIVPRLLDIRREYADEPAEK